MTVTYQYRIEEGYLHVVAEGSLCSVDEMLEHVGAAHKERARAALSKLLIDEKKCHMHMNFDAVENVSSARLGPNW